MSYPRTGTPSHVRAQFRQQALAALRDRCGRDAVQVALDAEADAGRLDLFGVARRHDLREVPANADVVARRFATAHGLAADR